MSMNTSDLAMMKISALDALERGDMMIVQRMTDALGRIAMSDSRSSIRIAAGRVLHQIDLAMKGESID